MPLDQLSFAYPPDPRTKAHTEGKRGECADLSQRFSDAEDVDLIIERLRAAVEISFDLETTALTPGSLPAKLAADAKIGGRTTLRSYRAQHACTFDPRPRARAFAAELDDGFRFALDIDKISEEQLRSVIRAMSRPDAVWIGHNLRFDLQFLDLALPGARPGEILDTILLPTAFRPGLPREMSAWCEQGGARSMTERQAIKAVKEWLHRRARGASSGGIPLSVLSQYYLHEPLDKRFQKPVNWTPSHLTDGHLRYCLGDIHAPRIAARRMLKLADDAPVSAIVDALYDGRTGAKSYIVFQRSLPRLAAMQRRGFRFEPAAARETIAGLKIEAEEAVGQLLAEAPELSDFREALLDPKCGESDALKDALATALKRATGLDMPRTDNGRISTNASALRQTFGEDGPIVAALDGAKTALKRWTTLDDYRLLAERDPAQRLHSLVGINAITGRTSSAEPNLQNIPRGDDVRGCFQAAPGNKIISTDFSAIEMRIAAALSVRAWRLANRGVNGLAGGVPAWIMRAGGPALRAALKAAQRNEPIIVPDDWPAEQPAGDTGPEAWGLYRAAQLARCLRDLQRAGVFGPEGERALPLARAFRDDLDPHLATAIGVEAQAGRFQIDGHPLDYLAALSAEDRKALKAQLKGPRQAAKALNFGLLYGMSAGGLHRHGVVNYGLSWTLDEAREARDAWFQLYPEIAFWHWQQATHLQLSSAAEPMYRLESFAEGAPIVVTERKWRFGATLSLRNVVGEELREAENYSDQGTGAEIALDAINSLPDWLAERLCNFVHDELVFEVEADRVEEAQREIESVMCEAGDRLLSSFGIPTAVESAIGDAWSH